MNIFQNNFEMISIVNKYSFAYQITYLLDDLFYGGLILLVSI